MTVVHRPTRVPEKAAWATIDLENNPDLIHYLSHNNVLFARAVLEMRPSQKHIEVKQREEEELIREGMEIEQERNTDTSSLAPQLSDYESDGSPDVLFLDESDMGSVYQESTRWAHRLEEALEQGDEAPHRVEQSEEAGMRVTITRTVPVVDAVPTPVPAPEPMPLKMTLTPIKAGLQLKVAPKVVTAAPTQPSTSQGQMETPKRKVKTVRRSQQDQDEDMDVDSDQAGTQVAKDVQPAQLKD